MIELNDTQAEKIITGTVLSQSARNGESFEVLEMIDQIPLDGFFDKALRTLIEIKRDLVQKEKPNSIVEVSMEAEKRIQVANIQSYVSEIFAKGQTKYQLPALIKKVRDLWVRRQVSRIASKALEEIQNPSIDAQELMTVTESKILEVRSESEKTTEAGKPLREFIDSAIGRYEDAFNGNNKPTLPIGLTGFDSKLGGGLRLGELTILAARPSQGKTALSVGMMQSLSINSDIPSLFISLEMTGDSVTDRIVSQQARIDGQSLSRGIITRETISRISKNLGKLQNSHLYIDDEPGQNAQQIASKMRRAAIKHGVRMVAIDYLQIIRASASFERSDERLKIDNALDVLKDTAKQLNVALVLLVQMGREAEGKPASELNMGMLKSSSKIEQDADCILLLGESEIKSEDPNFAYKAVQIAKQRNGGLGHQELIFEKKTTSFRENHTIYETK